MIDKKYKYCRRCGRRLTSELSREIGYGPVCFKKVQVLNKRNSLFRIKKPEKKLYNKRREGGDGKT